MVRLWEAVVMRSAGILALGWLAKVSVDYQQWWLTFLCGLGIFLLAGTEVKKYGKE